MKRNRIVVYFGFFCIICLVIFLFKLNTIYFSTINSSDKDFFISKNIHYDELLSLLKAEYNIPNYVFFELYCDKKRLFNFKSGKYVFKAGFSITDIINELRSSGNRKTINFTFKSFEDFMNRHMVKIFPFMKDFETLQLKFDGNVVVVRGAWNSINKLKKRLKILELV